MRNRLHFAVFLLLSGCAQPAVITDISDSSVTIQQTAFTKPESVTAEANRGCALYGKTALPLSTRCLDAYCTARLNLFACAGPNVVRGVDQMPARPAGSAATQPPVPMPAYQPTQPPPQPAALAPPQQNAVQTPAALPGTPAANDAFWDQPSGAASGTTAPAADPCAPYENDNIARIRCEWVTGPQRAEYVPAAGQNAPLDTQISCLPVRDRGQQYADCIRRGQL
jgi:hypothetical protein